MPGSDIVVIGGVNTDYVIRGERLPSRGETLQGEVFQEGPGGKGANQAVAIARLGCRVELIARLGEDGRGEAIRRQLAAEGVDVTRIQRDGHAATGVALIMVDHSGQKQILTASGANQRLTEADIHNVKDRVQSARVLLAQLEVPVPAVTLGLRLARAAGVKTVLDPAPAVPLSPDILQLVDVIRPNASEAETLTGVPVRDRNSAAAAARILLERGVGAAIVQAGEAGDLLVTAEEERFFPRFSVESVDATGAGDPLPPRSRPDWRKGVRSPRPPSWGARPPPSPQPGSARRRVFLIARSCCTSWRRRRRKLVRDPGGKAHEPRCVGNGLGRGGACPRLCQTSWSGAGPPAQSGGATDARSRSLPERMDQRPGRAG
jgi:ribokinase